MMQGSHVPVANRRWLPMFAPMKIMLATMVLVAVQAIVAVDWHIRQPYFGLPLLANSDAVLLWDHARQHTVPVTAIRIGDRTFPLTAESLNADPGAFSTFGQLNQFLAGQDALHDALEQAASVTLVNPHELSAAFDRRTRTLLDLPLNFWIFQVFGAIALLIGVAFWTFHRQQPATRILLLSGVGFALMEWSMSLYATRELALAGNLFRNLLALNHFGGMLYAGCAVGLLMFQPIQLMYRWMLWCGGLGLVFLWVNEWLQWITWPGNIFYFPSVGLLAAFIFLARRQYQLCKGLHAKQAQLVWLFTTLVAGLGLTFAFYVIPLLLTQQILISLVHANAVTLLVFIGFVMGAQRNALFGIHRWWLRSWIISGVVLVLVIMDISALLTLHYQVSIGFGLLAVLLGWLYLPLRQCCWKLLDTVQRKPLNIDHPLLPELMSRFSPLHFQVSPQRPENSQIDSGMVLAVEIEPDRFWLFTGKARGFRLFTAQDRTESQALLQQWNQTEDADKKVEAERTRIMRDLHDDVAADLLTLLHQDNDTKRQHLVRHTLHNLRAIIYSLQADAEQLLQDAAQRWQEDTRQRCQASHIHCRWHENLNGDTRRLALPYLLQIHRILREAVSNAIRHAQPSTIDVLLECSETGLQLEIRDNGHHLPVQQWLPGKGYISLQHRALLLNGSVQWHLEERDHQQWCVVSLSIPFTATAETQHAKRIVA